MHSYNHLNTYHFRCIFEFLNSESLYMQNFKSGLPIIAVCQSWRRAALPVVYNTLYLTDYFKPTRHIFHTVVKENIQCISNVGLIKSIDGFCFVKKCVIKLTSLRLLHTCIEKFDTFNPNVCQWPLITSLTIQLSITNNYPDENRQYYNLADKLNICFPNVHKINLENDKQRVFTNIFHSPLVCKYGDNIRTLTTDLNMYFKVSPNLCNLTSLTVKPLNTTRYLLAGINLQILKNLALLDMTTEYNWNVFVEKLDSNLSLNFSSLVNLKVTYSGRWHLRSSLASEISQPITLEYPVLQTLYVSGINRSNINENVQYVFSDCIKRIHAHGSIDVASWVARQNIKKCECLHITYSIRHWLEDDEYNTPEYSDALDTIFSSNKKYESVIAYTNIPRRYIKQDTLYWNNLHTLEMCNDIAFENLVLFIKHIPELRELDARHVCFQYRPQFSLVNRKTRLQQHLKPFNSKICTLKIRNACEMQSYDYITWCLDRLLLRLLKLKTFVTKHYTAQCLDGYSSMFKDKYPHSENLLISGSNNY